MTDFARIVTLACHDLRTPLATVRGFAKTLQRVAELPPAETRYLELIDAAAGELSDLLDILGLAARVEAGRYELVLTDVDTSKLAHEVAASVGADQVAVTGDGVATRLDADVTRQSLAGFARCALRHGPLERVELTVDGARFQLAPVHERLAQILLGDDPKDLGAAIATRVLRALGGKVEVAADALVVEPPLERA